MSLARLAALLGQLLAAEAEVPLALPQAVALALEHHPRLQLRVAERDEAQARGRALDRQLWPALSANLNHGFLAEPIFGSPYSLFRPYDRSAAHTTQLTLGASGQVPQLGTRYRLGVEGRRTATDRVDASLSSQFQLSLSAELRQPLWRSAWGTDLALATESLRLAGKAADQRFTAEAQALVLQVVESYWSAARAARLLEIRRKARENAAQTLKATEALLAAGRTTAEVLLAARAEVARRDQELLEAQLRKARADAALAVLLQPAGASGPAPRFSLTEPPQALDGVRVPELDALLETATSQSPTLQALSSLREAAIADSRLTERAVLPDVSVNLRGGLLGLGGQSACPSGFLRDGISSCAVPAVIASGPVSGALTTLGRGSYPFWEAGLSVETAFDDVTAYQAIASARRRLSQAQTEYELARLALVSEVRLRLEELGLEQARAREADHAVELAQQAHQALLQRFKLGGATIFDINRSLDTLVLAEDAASSASIDLTLAVARVQQFEPGALLTHFHLEPTSGQRP